MTEQATVGASSPPRLIRGYWDSHQRYRFVDCASRTDPRPRSEQPFRRGRTMSSSSEPSHGQPRMRRPDTSDSSAIEDIFWNSPVPELPSSRGNDDFQSSAVSANERYWSPLGSDGMGYGDPIRNTSDRHSSGTSTTSQPYSFYELPDSSRHSSSTYSQAEPLTQAQYDGAAPSRQVSHDFNRGAYHSIRLSRVRALSGAQLRPPPPSRVPSTSSPDLTALGQQPSPLPAMPYGRVTNVQHPSVPYSGLINITDLVGGDQDASRAIQRDLSSPLELIQERANAYFEQISARLQASSLQSRTRDSRLQNPQHHEEAASRTRRTSDSGSSRHDSGNSAHIRSNAQPRARMSFAPIPVPVSDSLDHAPPVQARVHQVPRRPVNAARTGHRSSENAHVNQLAQEIRPDRASIQRSSLLPRPARRTSSVAMRGGELSTSPAMARLSVPPQMPRPREMSNRLPIHSTHSIPLSSDDDPSNSDTFTPVPETAADSAVPNPTRGPRIPPRHASRQDVPSDTQQRQPIGRAVTPIPSQLPFSRQSERGLPSTSTTLDSASGVISRRPVPWAVTRRRVDDEQENSEEREREDMRGEIAGVGWRVGTEGRADVMDETPPKMGRYENFLSN